MKKFLSLAVLALVVGCSNPSAIDYHVCETIGTVDDVRVDYGQDFITVRDFNSISTSGDIYFYLNERILYCNEVVIASIPDGSLIVDGYEFNNLSAMINTDASGKWYMQIIKTGSNLCMSIGAKVEIKSFTVRW